MPIVDLFAIACGFVLRVWGGAVAIDVMLSAWMFITTLSLAQWPVIFRPNCSARGNRPARESLFRFSKTKTPTLASA